MRYYTGIKKIVFIYLLFFNLFLIANEPIDYVNMMIGTTGRHKTEYGGTTPAVSTPFGMTQWCAVTRVNEISKTMYHYNDSSIIGFMATHQPAIWMGDYGFFTMMPQCGTLKISPQERKVRLDRKNEIATPYYYCVKYGDDVDKMINTEFTATSRCSYFRIRYPKNEKNIFFIEAGREKSGGYIQIVPEKQEVRILNKEHHDSHLGPKLKKFGGYYVLKFSKPFKNSGVWSNGEIISGLNKISGSNVGGYIEFDEKTELVEVRIGSSFIDYNQALDNMKREIPEKYSFDKVKRMVRKEWSDKLNKIKLKGASEDDLEIFYTAYFRTMQYPREFSEYGRYYSPFDEKIHQGVSYNAYSLWDTFRAQHPWLLLTNPNRVDDMVTSLVQMYKEGGWIPKWPNLTYTNIMIGTHADAVIADAYVNGFRGYDLESAYKAIRKNAFVAPKNDENFKWGDRHLWSGCYEARGGLTNYINKGYVASDKTWESVSRTLEFALDDYCIAQMAKGLGYMNDYDILMKRSKNYINLYNDSTGFFQAKRFDGTWDNPNTGFTEGGKWTYRFCVMQDVPGMVELMGGKNSFINKLNENFVKNHYRHDNEPGHHYVYLFSKCGRLDRTQELVPEIISSNYKNKPDGLSGNDDCGQMSAWYLFSALGFYPLTPASGEYVLGIPRFEEIKVDLQNGKNLRIKAKDLRNNKTLTKVKFNGKVLSSNTVSIKDILNGGILEFLPQ